MAFPRIFFPDTENFKKKSQCQEKISVAAVKGIKSKKSLDFGMPPFVAERSKARGSGPRLARGMGSNPTHLRAFAASFSGVVQGKVVQI